MIDRHYCLKCGGFKNRTEVRVYSICACGFWVFIENAQTPEEADLYGYLAYKNESRNSGRSSVPVGCLLVMDWEYVVEYKEEN